MSRLRPALLALAAGCVVEALGHPVPNVRAAVPPPLLDVWSWGLGTSGQLGAVPPNPTIPWPIQDVKRWVAVSAGSDHALGLTDTGEVWGWGSNEYGQMGSGAPFGSILPVPVPVPSGVTAVAAGTLHSLAYRASDGTLWAWGSNAQGQLGQPSLVAESQIPVEIQGLGALREIAVGGVHSLVLTVDGKVFAWGGNSYGQLGVGDFDERFAPVEVPLPEVATSIAGGSAHSLAALSSGAVWTWGWNVFGQLGHGYQGVPELGEPDPAPAVNVSGAVQVSAGDLHAAARTADGHVYSWGYNTEGQVGNGERTPSYTGVLSPALLAIDSVAVVDAGGLHSMALRTNGEVWTWGNNQYGACGDNGRSDHQSPVRVPGLEGAQTVSAGGRFSLALAAPQGSTGVTVVGAKGAEMALPAVHPAVTLVPALTDVVDLASGFRHTLALDAERRVWAWGDNSVGQLGWDGAGNDVPTLVGLPLDGARGFVQVVARANHGFALRSDGAVWAWGDNQWGQLGLGAKAARALPTKVAGLAGIAAVAAGEQHGMALDRFGQVWAWGQNDHGQLGAPMRDTELLQPKQIAVLRSMTGIAAGGFHGLALDGVGNLHVWGSGFRGQLARADLRDDDEPNLVGMGRVTTVSAGRYHTLAIAEGGTVWAFGDVDECQTGTGVVDGVAEPLAVPGVPRSRVVRAGDYHGVVLTEGGALFGWGNDAGGQLGRSDLTRSHYDCSAESFGTATIPVAFSAGLASTAIAGR